MGKMKAVVLNGFGDVSNFSLAEIDIPVPKEQELLIKIKAAAFNPIDYQMRLGRRESQLMHSPVMGRELSGVVVAVGKEVRGFLPGDEVIAASGSRGSNGTYAEFMALNYKVVAHKPATISFEAAAAIPSAGLTAWQTFKRMNAKSNETVFITGGPGAVGSFLIKILKANGIHHIVTTAGNENSRQALMAMGLNAAGIIHYRQQELVQKILAANNNRHFDWAIDIVGDDISTIAAEVLRVHGGYVDITFMGTVKTRELLFDKGCTVINISNYSYSLNNDIEWYGQSLEHLTKLIVDKTIAPPLVKVVGHLGIEAVQVAHTLMETNQTKGRKLVMTVNDEASA